MLLKQVGEKEIDEMLTIPTSAQQAVALGWMISAFC
jgi:hypothetical protein